MPPLTRRTGINLALAGLLLYVLVPALGGFDYTRDMLGQANLPLLLLAALCIAGSYVAAALVYYWLAFKPVPYWPTLQVQVAGGFLNRILPAGLGGLGLNLLYLMKRRHSAPSATAIIATNNLLGLGGNIFLLASAIVWTGISLPSLRLLNVGLVGRVGLLLALCAVVLLSIALHVWRQKIGKFIVRTAAQLWTYRHRPARLGLALLSSMLLTTLHIGALSLVAVALHEPITPSAALLAISAGVLAGALLPTPGGLGGAEAGITAVLTATGMFPGAALTIALTYRLLTFWLPIIPGFMALHIVQKKYL